MDCDEFCRKFDCGKMELEAFIEERMPWHGERSDPEFDEPEVASWLFVNGKATIDTSKVARSATDAADRLGISRQTLHTWAKVDGFPGRPGFYPLREICDWNESRDKKLNQYTTEAEAEEKSSDRSLSIKEQRDLLKLKQEQGELIEVAEVCRDIQRSYAYAVSELNLIAPKVESKLPADLDQELVRIIRDTIRQTLHEVRTILADHEHNYRDDEDNTKSMENAEQSAELIH